MKKLVCEKDIQALVNEGKKVCYIAEGTLVTPSAKDAARAAGIEISYGEEPKACCETPAACVAPAPAPAAAPVAPAAAPAQRQAVSPAQEHQAHRQPAQTTAPVQNQAGQNGVTVSLPQNSNQENALGNRNIRLP